MCRYLDSDVIVGNALIRYATKNTSGTRQISFELILAFEKTVSNRLEKEDCYIRFSRDPIAEFENDYPFFVSRTIPSTKAWEIKVDRLEVLRRYFRDGLPPNLANIFEELDNEDSVTMSTYP